LRPQQWLKNLLVFAPVFFAGDVLHTGYLSGAFWAAIVFSSAASAMYVLNDMRDLAQDRAHPTKSGRPLASGAVSLSTGWILASACVALAFLGCVLIPALFPVIALYIVGNLLYSYVLKHVAVIDIVLVAFFYILRVIAGGAATLVYVSPWILLCVFFGALFLVAGKRRAEFVHSHKRRVLESYTKESLDLILVSAATLAVTAYGLYSVLAARSPYVIYSALLVIVVIFRALLRILRGDTDAEYPETMILRDKWSLAAGVAWLCFMAAVFYWHL
jgi:4-hydroxybenzoate polyprenyltransferase